MSNKINLNVINPIQSVSQVIEKLSEFPGVHIDTVNFRKVVDAVAAGHNVINVLENPVELANIAPQQAHYFVKFLNTITIPKKLRRIKNIRVIVAQADLDTIDDNLISQRDYTDLWVGEDKTSGFKVVASSYAFERLAPYHNATLQMATTKQRIGDEVIEKEVLALVIPHICFTDLNSMKDGDDKQKELNDAKRARIIKEGMKFKKADGTIGTFLYAMQSPSQERTVSIVSTDKDVIHPVDVLNVIGMKPFTFAKKVGVNEQGESVYKLDYVKAKKRFGLTLSNSVKSNFIRIGKDIFRDEKTGDVIIRGGNVTVRIVEDVYSRVSSGLYKAFGKDIKRGQVFDAANNPVVQTAGDGQIYFNARVKNLGEKEFGRSFQNGVTRMFSGFSKGNGVYIPNLENYFEEDIIIPMSSFKPKTDTLEDVINDIDVQFRVALFGTPLRYKKQYVRIPYQFVHGMRLSAQAMFKLVRPHLDRVEKMLKDPELIQEYLGLDKISDLSEFSQEEQEEKLESTLVSTLTTFLHYAPKSYVDVYLKEKALDMLKELVKEWKAGSIPVEANYRFLVQDPYAILQTYKNRGTDKEIRINGDLFVDPNMGMKANTVFMFKRDGNGIQLGNIAIARNPQMTEGQSRVVEARAYNRYMNTKGAFDGMLVMSVHDFNALAMGGADFDGDTALVMTQPELIEAVERANKYAPAFLDIHFWEDENGEYVFADGCPYTEDPKKLEKYVYTFTKSEYTRDLEMKMYEESLDYVVDSLKPNRIGELTNYATKLADAVRVMRDQVIAIRDTNPNQAQYLMGRIKDLHEKIDLLGWVQSWEIDRAKHGGAYEKELQEELDFIQNPPIEVSYFDSKSKTHKWFTPDWMGFLKGKQVDGLTVRQTNSVLSQVHQYVSQWEQTELIDVVQSMRNEYMNNNILGELTTSIALPENGVERMELVNAVRKVKNRYNFSVKKAYEHYEDEVAKLEFLNFSSSAAKEKAIESIDKDRKDLLALATEVARAELEVLSDAFTPEQVGLIAYQLTYEVAASKRKADEEAPARGLSFPWITRDALLAAVMKTYNTESMPTVKRQVKQFSPEELEINKVNIGNFAPGLNSEMIAGLMSNWNNQLAIKAEEVSGGLIYNVYVRQQRVASVFPNHITHFAGGRNFVVKGAKVTPNKKSLTFYIEAIMKF